MLSLASMALAAPAITKRAEPAPVLAARDTSKAIAGKYIVKMKNSAEITIAADTYKAQHRYSSDKFRGFAASLTEADLNELRNHSDVSLEKGGWGDCETNDGDEFLEGIDC